MSDLISRQEAIDKVEMLAKKYFDHPVILRSVRDMIEQLPSAQPEKRTEERTETHACDLISRQEAIEALKKQMSDWNDLYNISVRRSIAILEQLPSAQPEIIFCKDCKFWKAYGYINGKPEFLPKCGFNQIYTSKDDFCSRAERKNNG